MRHARSSRTSLVNLPLFPPLPAAPPRNWKLSPSDFAFLWQECKRCFYLKVALNQQRPRSVMPKIFTVIDEEMKRHFAGRRANEAVPGLPPGTFRFDVDWVESLPIRAPGHSSTCFIRGKLDSLIQFDDKSYAVVDFKTSGQKEGHIALYARQLHAYAHALENAAPGRAALKPIRRLGLLVFEPDAFAAAREGKASLSGSLAWMEIPRDDAAFERFLGEVLTVLELPAPPPPSPGCEWCNYRDAGRKSGL
jgi:hypothetical protein